MRKRLLCVADFTKRSDDVIARTVHIARATDAQVLFVHAVSDSHSGRVLRMKVNRAHARLLSLAERAMKHAPSDASIAVRIGKPLQVITEAASEWEPDLIVMGSPRRSRLDYLLGTTAERVIRATARAVLVVSQPAVAPYSKVVLASDLTSTARSVARTAASMRVLEDARAWVVHGFSPPYQGFVTRDALDPQQIERADRSWRERMHRELLQELVAAEVDLKRVNIAAQAASPFGAIRFTLEMTKADLLVIGTSRWFALKRLLFGSVADEVFRNVQCDVLAVPPVHVETAVATRAPVSLADAVTASQPGI